MRQRLKTCRILSALLIPCLAAGVPGSVLAARPEILLEPKPLRLRISDAALQFWIEQSLLRTRYASSSEVLTRETFGYSPTATFTASGSLYHPNLLTFSFRPEIGYAWYRKHDDAFDPPDGEETDRVLNYTATATLLGAKPYALSLLAEHLKTVRNDDFFTRQEIDSTHYAAQSGYTAGPVPLSLRAGHREERVEEFRVFETIENTFSADAHNNRGINNSTIANYYYEEFTYKERDFDDKGIRHTANLSDREVFGPGDRYNLNSSIRYEDTTRNDSTAESLTLREDFRVQHRPNLSSEYDYQFGDRRSGESESRSHEFNTHLRHQLYESLASTLSADSGLISDSGPDSSVDRFRYGLGISERYTKKLPSASRLGLDAGGHYSSQHGEASGSAYSVLDEPHLLRDGDITFLNLPDVDRSTIVVTDTGGTRIYQEGADYTVAQRGRSTQIERVPGGRIRDGATVLVSYSSASTGGTRYTTFQHSYGFRMDLWNRRLGLYARRYQTDSAGDADRTIESASDTVAGIDTTYKTFRAGLEYENYDSNLSRYQTWRAFQSLSMHPSKVSTANFDMRQQRTHFENDGDDQELFSFTARYETRLARTLAWRTEAGAQYERGIGLVDYDRDRYTARTYLDYWIGKVTMRLSYEYHYTDYVSDKSESHFAVLRMQRRL